MSTENRFYNLEGAFIRDDRNIDERLSRLNHKNCWVEFKDYMRFFHSAVVMNSEEAIRMFKELSARYGTTLTDQEVQIKLYEPRT